MKKNVCKIKLIITSIVILVFIVVGCSDGNKSSSTVSDKSNSSEDHGHAH